MRARSAIIDTLGAHGGLHYYVHDQADALVAAGHEVIVYSAPAKTDKAGHYSKVTTFTNIFGDGPKLLRGLRLGVQLVTAIVGSRARGCRVCIFHIFKGDAFELMSVVVTRALGMRAICIIHDVERLDRSSGVRLMAVVMRLANQLVVHNEFSRQTLLGHHPEMAAKTAIVPHGNYVSQFSRLPSKEEARQQLGLSQDRFTMLFFGNPRREKGLDLLLHALSLRGAKLKITLVVAGKMKVDEAARVRAFLRDNDLEDMVRLDVGHVEDELVAPYFRAADVVVLPYLRVYESGVALMAMTLERPVLASDLPPLAEAVGRDGQRGSLFRAGDASSLAEQIDSVCLHAEELAIKGVAAAAFARNERDWARSGRLLSELLGRQ